MKLARLAVGESAAADFDGNMDQTETSNSNNNSLVNSNSLYQDDSNVDLMQTATNNIFHSSEESHLQILSLAENSDGNHLNAVSVLKEQCNRVATIFEKNFTPETTFYLIHFYNHLSNIQTPAQALKFIIEKSHHATIGRTIQKN